MEAKPVDPRDIEWERPQPTYRVYFWEQAPAVPSVEGAVPGWRCEEWRLSDAADAHEVLRWIPTVSRDRSYTLYVETCSGAEERLGLIRLAGTDPTISD